MKAFCEYAEELRSEIGTDINYRIEDDGKTAGIWIERPDGIRKIRVDRKISLDTMFSCWNRKEFLRGEFEKLTRDFNEILEGGI